VDIWALGVLTYVLLSGGEFPFTGRFNKMLSWEIKNEIPNYTFINKYHNAGILLDFMQKTLAKNPMCRLSAEQLLQHEWLEATCEIDVPDSELISIGNNFWDF
jgi:serine/threonine protein kinase